MFRELSRKTKIALAIAFGVLVVSVCAFFFIPRKETHVNQPVPTIRVILERESVPIQTVVQQDLDSAKLDRLQEKYKGF